MLSCKTYEWLERSSYKCPYVTEEGPDAPLSGSLSQAQVMQGGG